MPQVLKNKRFIVLTSIILFLIIGSFCFWNFNLKDSKVDAAGESWLTGWTYRKPITVTNNTPACTVSSGLTCTTTTSGGYVINTFTGSGTWTVPSGVTSVDYLVVAGGGGGGGAHQTPAGGGGGGGVLAGSGATVVSGNSYTVTVGAGGAGGTVPSQGASGANGANSVFSTFTAIGGGGGGAYNGQLYGSNGGAGGGGAYGGAGGTGTSGQGSSGGAGYTGGSQCSGGGGGGGGIGTAGSSTTGGNGGGGVQSSITGTATYYGGGGGGTFYSSGSVGSGGSGGGGAGGASSNSYHGVAGTANTGGGGGGAGGTTTADAYGAAGGSGIVIIRYVAPTLTNYQTKITVPYVSGMKTDFSDLRFTSSDGTTELSYWIESYTASTSAVVWVKVPSLVSGSNTIYMYYGKSSATTTSNGDNTFVFFDDFTGTTINTSKWTKVDTSPSSCVSGGGVTCTSTTSGGYIVNTFTGAGSTTWTVPTGVTSVDYLVVAGGGGGGGAGGGGGGAGGLKTATNFTVTPGTSPTVTVGAGGGVATNGQGTSGSNSVFSSITATGGGGGASGYVITGLNGGSGGGGSAYSGTPGTGTSGQGNAGGTGAARPGLNGGGGGGAGAAGQAGTASVGGAGGSGSASSISGSSIVYAGGGGGHSNGAGGAGGGGAGSIHPNSGSAGTNGLGGGGGGGAGAASGGVGGSGIVIVRYLAPTTSNISQNGVLTIANGNMDWTQTGMYTVGNFNRADGLVVQGKYKSTMARGSTYQDTTMLWVKDTDATVSYANFIYGFYLNSAGTPTFNMYEDGTSRGAATGTFTANTQYNIRQIINSTGATTQISTDSGNTWATAYTSAYSTETPFKVGFTHYQGGDVIMDDIIVRKYASTEPTVTIGSEESLVLDCGTGGTVTKVNGYCIHKFTTVGTTTWAVPTGVTSVDYLVVAGGGGGGSDLGGGGGAGGVLTGNGYSLSTATYTVTVGAGGAGGQQVRQSTSLGTNGSNSVFGSLTAVGGGGGGAYWASNSVYDVGKSGGSGGGNGAKDSTTVATVGSGTSGQGNNGGTSGYNPGYPGGGGGGAGGAGGNSGTQTGGGAGGIGLLSSISGVATYYGGGGGGSNYSSSSANTSGGAGGAGGGGNGGYNVNSGGTSVGGNGTANTGGGGGGGSWTGSTPSIGGTGGSGIVIIRYPILAEVTPISSPTTDTTPSYTFSSIKAGTITYGGGCSSSTTSAVAGNNTITFNALAAGAHSCTIAISDSNVLTVAFTVSSFATYTSPNLSCTLTNESCTGTNEAIIFKIYDPAGNHAELSTQSNYSYKVCCTGAGISNSCSGNYDTVLKLSAATNAHAEKKTLSNYTNNVCLSSSTMGATCGYSANTSCSDLGTNYVCLASISGDTNAHVGECSTYSTKVCCRIIVLVDACTAKVSSNKPITSKDVDIQLCSGADVTNTSDPCYPVCWKGTGTPNLTSSDWKCGVCHDVSNSPVSCSSTAASATFAWGMPSGYIENTNYTLIDDTTLASANPIIRFTAQDSNRIVTLGINSMGVSCSGQNSIQLTPTWREISPF